MIAVGDLRDIESLTVVCVVTVVVTGAGVVVVWGAGGAGTEIVNCPFREPKAFEAVKKTV